MAEDKPKDETQSAAQETVTPPVTTPEVPPAALPFENVVDREYVPDIYVARVQ